MQFDCIVIGSGVAGLTVAYGLNKEGKNVAIIEANYFGGVVNNVGSTRKKELVTVAEHLLLNQRFEEQGMVTPIQANWQETMNWIDSLEDDEDSENQRSLEKSGITTIYGEAEFISKNEVIVDGIVYSASLFVIATGAKDRPFTFQGEQYLSDSAAFLTQHQLPKEILLIGAGIISFAFMTIASAFGSKVTVLQHNSLALKNFDQEFVKQLIEVNKKRGIAFHFNEKVVEIKQLETGRLLVQTASGKEVEVDKVVNVAGRIPLIESLNLEKAGVQYNQHGIIVNEYLETSQSNIVACGDCCTAQVPKLATYAVYQADYLVSHILKKDLTPITYPLSAMSIFSEPRIAQTGMTTAQAKTEPDRYEIQAVDSSKWTDGKRKAEKNARLKVVLRKSDNRLVGATAISQEADILINYITMGLHAEWTKVELKHQIYAYPSIVNELTRFWK